MSYYFFFFFQAEDGIRDTSVTGVQTCALPIWTLQTLSIIQPVGSACRKHHRRTGTVGFLYAPGNESGAPRHVVRLSAQRGIHRSEERRVGKECRSRWGA